MMIRVPYLLHAHALELFGAALVGLSTLAALLLVPSAPPSESSRAVTAAYDFAPLTFSGYEDFTDTTRPTPLHRSESYSISGSENALQIQRIDVSQFIGAALDVSVSIINERDTPISGLTWFLLAPPDSPQPWANAVYVSNEIPVQLDARSSETVRLDADDLPNGIFDLSVWVHTVNSDGTRIHSDGQGFGNPIDIGNPYEMDVEFDGTTLVTTVHSRLSMPSTFSLSVTINSTDDLAPWEAVPIERLVFDLESGETWTRPFTITPISEGSRVIVWLHELDGDVFSLVASRALDVTS